MHDVVMQEVEDVALVMAVLAGHDGVVAVVVMMGRVVLMAEH